MTDTPTPDLAEQSEPNPEWEARYNDAHAKQVAEHGVDSEATLRMLETWKSEAEPANEHGQASFSRAMLESATDALRVTIAAAAERDELRALLVRAGEAMEPFADFGRYEGLQPTDLMRERICDWFGLSDFNDAFAALSAITRATQTDTTDTEARDA